MAESRAYADEGLSFGESRARWVLAATVLGSGLAFLDATVVNVALPRIGASLDAGMSGLQWTVNAYALTLAALTLLGGSLGDRFGRRRIFVVGVVWFAVASLACGLAQEVVSLSRARALQGVGGALLTPGSLAILQSTFRPEDRARAIGAWSGLAGIAGAAGPFLGGWLVEHAGWRWVFLLNLPLAVAVVVVAVRYVPESRDPQAAQTLDLAGAAVGALGLGALTYGLIAWQERGLYAALGGVFLFLVLMLQVVAGLSPLAAGATLLPVTLVLLALSARVGALSTRIGPRLPMTAGPALAGVAVLLMARFDGDSSYVAEVLPLVAGLDGSSYADPTSCCRPTGPRCSSARPCCSSAVRSPRSPCAPHARGRDRTGRDPPSPALRRGRPRHGDLPPPRAACRAGDPIGAVAS